MYIVIVSLTLIVASLIVIVMSVRLIDSLVIPTQTYCNFSVLFSHEYVTDVYQTSLMLIVMSPISTVPSSMFIVTPTGSISISKTS